MGDYDDLDIEVQRGRVSFRIGERDYVGEPDFSAGTLASLRAALYEGTPDEYGIALREAAFKGTARDGLKRLNELIDEGHKWRFRLNIDHGAPELHGIRWECLFHQEELMARRRLGTSPKTPLSRYLALQTQREPPRIDTLRVLVVIANADSLGGGTWERYPRLNEATEQLVLEAAFAELNVEYEFQKHPATPWAIRQRLDDDEFHVLHVVGHGFRDPDQRGLLLLERPGEGGTEVDPVDQDRLAGMVSDLDELMLVVLAACHSAARSDADVFLGLAPTMVRQGVPAVIAMQDIVEQSAARTFATRFYQSLINSPKSMGLVDAAVNQGREHLWQVELAPWTWSVPVLFMRGTGKLFEPSQEVQPQRPSPQPRRGPTQIAPMPSQEKTRQEPPPLRLVQRAGKARSYEDLAWERMVLRECRLLLAIASVDPSVLEAFLNDVGWNEPSLEPDEEQLKDHIVSRRMGGFLHNWIELHRSRADYGIIGERRRWAT